MKNNYKEKQFKDLLNEFISLQKKRYGQGIFLEQEQGKLIVLTKAQRITLEEIVEKCDSDKKVVSVEESEGEEKQIVLSPVFLYTNPREDINLVADQLLPGEGLRVCRSSHFPGWLAVAVHHDFEKVAPLELGWVKDSPNIGPVKSGDLVSSSLRKGSLESAVKFFLGIKYRLGGKTKDFRIDCSGLVQQIVWQTKGLLLPRLSRWQALVGKRVLPGQEKIGDLIIFGKLPGKKISHVVLVFKKAAKSTLVVHSSIYSGDVTVENLKNVIDREDSQGREIVAVRRIEAFKK